MAPQQNRREAPVWSGSVHGTGHLILSEMCPQVALKLAANGAGRAVNPFGGFILQVLEEVLHWLPA